MEQFNLKSSTNNLLEEFELISDKGFMAVLEWFYQAKDFKNIFTTPEYAKRLYNRLVSKGYKEILSAREELECFKELMKKDEQNDGERIGIYLISLIMKSLKEESPLSVSLEQFICIYNEIYNKIRTYESMMENLKNHIGESVVYIINEYGKLKFLSGTLDAVDAFHSVTINGEIKNFIGFQEVLAQITDSDGKVLYNNGQATLYDDLNDYNAIEKRCENLFGNNYRKVSIPM